MKFKTIILLMFFTLFLSGCGNQYTCGYDPDKFKLTHMFSIKNENVDITGPKLDKKIEKFGVDNGYCVANKSRDTIDDNYLTNIQIIKDDYSFYIYGTKKYIFKFENKKRSSNPKEADLFCNYISSYLNFEKSDYYDGVGKLCLDYQNVQTQ